MNKLGLIIANDDEEFLSDFYLSSFATLSAWAKTPALSYVFSTRNELETVLKRLPKRCRLWSLELHETENDFFVTTGSLIKPKWLLGLH